MGAISLEVIDLPNVEDCIYLIPISDTHIGDPLFNRKKLEGYLKWVAGMRRGFRPAKLGSPRLRLDATRKDCHVSF